MLSAAFVPADIASSVGSGAVLTLAFPLGATLVAFVVWWVVLRRRGLLRAAVAGAHRELGGAAGRRGRPLRPLAGPGQGVGEAPVALLVAVA
ncbi:MAG: hypothetical protein JO243_15760 [Solirubrobacterales bacterium]|nr:hypothetical protein [Solirubrobacterales bacterium]